MAGHWYVTDWCKPGHSGYGWSLGTRSRGWYFVVCSISNLEMLETFWDLSWLLRKQHKMNQNDYKMTHRIHWRYHPDPSSNNRAHEACRNHQKPALQELYNAALKDVQRAAAASPEERQRCGQRLALISKDGGWTSTDALKTNQGLATTNIYETQQNWWVGLWSKQKCRAWGCRSNFSVTWCFVKKSCRCASWIFTRSHKTHSNTIWTGWCPPWSHCRTFINDTNKWSLACHSLPQWSSKHVKTYIWYSYTWGMNAKRQLFGYIWMWNALKYGVPGFWVSAVYTHAVSPILSHESTPFPPSGIIKHGLLFKSLINLIYFDDFPYFPMENQRNHHFSICKSSINGP